MTSAERAVVRAQFQAIILHGFNDEEIKRYMEIAAQRMGPLNKANIRRNDHKG